MNNSTPTAAYRLETFRSTGSISVTASQQLRCYFVTKCNFPSTQPTTVPGQKTDIRSVSDLTFLDRVSKHTLDLYQQVVWFPESSNAMLTLFLDYVECRVTIWPRYGGFWSRGHSWEEAGHWIQDGRHFWILQVNFYVCTDSPGRPLFPRSALSNLYHFYSLYSARKYVGTCNILSSRGSIAQSCFQNNFRTELPLFPFTSTLSPTVTRHPSRIRSSRSWKRLPCCSASPIIHSSCRSRWDPMPCKRPPMPVCCRS